MSTFLYIVFFLSCIVLVIAVLLQPGKTDAGALFTSGVSSAALNPRGTASVLSKITIGAACVFMLTALLLSLPAITGTSSVFDSSSGTEAATPASSEKKDGDDSKAAATDSDKESDDKKDSDTDASKVDDKEEKSDGDSKDSDDAKSGDNGESGADKKEDGEKKSEAETKVEKPEEKEEK